MGCMRLAIYKMSTKTNNVQQWHNTLETHRIWTWSRWIRGERPEHFPEVAGPSKREQCPVVDVFLKTKRLLHMSLTCFKPCLYIYIYIYVLKIIVPFIWAVLYDLLHHLLTARPFNKHCIYIFQPLQGQATS